MASLHQELAARRAVLDPHQQVALEAFEHILAARAAWRRARTGVERHEAFERYQDAQRAALRVLPIGEVIGTIYDAQRAERTGSPR